MLCLLKHTILSNILTCLYKNLHQCKMIFYFLVYIKISTLQHIYNNSLKYNKELFSQWSNESKIKM